MSEKKQPSAAEAMFFYAIVKHTKNKADIDWDGVAGDAGFKNAEVAKVRFGQIRRKLGISEASPKKPKAAGGGGSSSAGPSPLKPGGGSKVTKKPGGGSKVTKKPAAPRKKAVKKEKSEEEDEQVDRKQTVKKEKKSEEQVQEGGGEFIFEDEFDPGRQLEMEMMGGM